MHGKASRIRHDGTGLFAGLPNPFPAARYHSLVISRSRLPAELRVTASAEDGEIMAVEHARHPVIGLQFHPESVLTEYGYVLLDRFLHGEPRASRTCRTTRTRSRRLQPSWCGDHRVRAHDHGCTWSNQLRAMGVEWGEEEIVIKPFLETTTFKNLEASRVAVVNLTDDVMVFAQGAIANAQFPAVPAAVVHGVVLEAACSWRRWKCAPGPDPTSRADRDARGAPRRAARVPGFNRARDAVLEAAILATRTHLLPAEQIRADFARLQVIVDKTAGPREREAMALLTEYVRAAREAAHA